MERAEGSPLDRDVLINAGETWLQWLWDVRGFKPSSVEKYRSQILVFLRLIPGPRYTVDDLRRAIDVRMGERSTPSVRYSFWNAMTDFFKWWADHGGIDNPLAGRLTPPPPEPALDGLDDTQLKFLLLRIRSAEAKEKAVVLLMVIDGLRPNEVAVLETESIEWNAGWIHIKDSKGGKGRRVPLGKVVRTALQNHMTTSNIRSGYLFSGRNGAMTTRGIREVWNRVGIKGIRPYALRHTAATELLRGVGTDIVTVQQILGHKRLTTTQLYIKLDPQSKQVAIANLEDYYLRKGLA